MDLITSPFVTVILNIVASVLISWGILDSHSAVALVQFGNNFIAGATTVIVSGYSIYKVVELRKHEISTTTPSQFSQNTPNFSQTGQSGLPSDGKSA